MPDITLDINGRPYPLTCDEGQEEHLLTLGGMLDKKATAIAERLGTGVGDQRILLMAALEVADEAYEIQRDSSQIPATTDEAIEQAQDYIIDIFSHLAGRLNTVADHLQEAIDNAAAVSE